MTCKKCGQPGHMQKTCGRPKREKTGRTVTCANCMQPGHRDVRCPSARVSSEQAASNRLLLRRLAQKRHYERMSDDAKARKIEMAKTRGWAPSAEQARAALSKHHGRVARAREWMRAFKTGRPCMDCGGVFEHVCMDFDHRPGITKKSGISQLVKRGASQYQIDEEIAKCDFVCANCHRMRTFARGQQGQRHGVT